MRPRCAGHSRGLLRQAALGRGGCEFCLIGATAGQSPGACRARIFKASPAETPASMPLARECRKRGLGGAVGSGLEGSREKCAVEKREEYETGALCEPQRLPDRRKN